MSTQPHINGGWPESIFPSSRRQALMSSQRRPGGQRFHPPECGCTAAAGKASAFGLVLLGLALMACDSRAAQSTWDAVGSVLPNETTPPWMLASSSNALTYLANDSGNVAALTSSQLVDNVYFEQSGARLLMTNHLASAGTSSSGR